MGYIGIAIIFLFLALGLTFMWNDISKRIKRIYKYDINFSKKYKTCGLPLVKLKINGKLEYFLVDSGASVNLMKQSYFDEVGDGQEIIPDNVKLQTGGGSVVSNNCVFSLSYNKTKFPDEKFSLAELTVFDSLEKAYGYSIIGIVGTPFMSKYKWSIDFDDLIVWIRK